MVAPSGERLRGKGRHGEFAGKSCVTIPERIGGKVLTMGRAAIQIYVPLYVLPLRSMHGRFIATSSRDYVNYFRYIRLDTGNKFGHLREF